MMFVYIILYNTVLNGRCGYEIKYLLPYSPPCLRLASYVVRVLTQGKKHIVSALMIIDIFVIRHRDLRPVLASVQPEIAV